MALFRVYPLQLTAGVIYHFDNMWLVCIKELSEFPEIDTSYFLPWSLDMLYQVEPALKQTAARTVS